MTDQALFNSPTLENIWADFKDARSKKDLQRMKLCEREFGLEDISHIASPVVQFRIRAAYRVMAKSISRAQNILVEPNSYGSW